MTDLNALKAPFPPEAISWRVGSMTKDKSKGMALAYLDSRDVQARLDDVCGPEGWQCRYPHAAQKTICEIGIKVGDEWIWKADGAGDSDIEAEKGAISDAFKRAAVKWGIGRYLYDVESPWVKVDEWKKIDPSELPRLHRLLGGSLPKQPKAAVPTTPLPAGLEPTPHVSNEAQKLVADALIVALRKAQSLDDLKAWWTDPKTQAALKGLPEAQLVRVREAKAERHIEIEDGVPA